MWQRPGLPSGGHRQRCGAITFPLAGAAERLHPIPKTRPGKRSGSCTPLFGPGSPWGRTALGVQHARSLLTRGRARSGDAPARPPQFGSSPGLCLLASSCPPTASQAAAGALGESWGSGHLCARRVASPAEVVCPTAVSGAVLQTWHADPLLPAALRWDSVKGVVPCWCC